MVLPIEVGGERQLRSVCVDGPMLFTAISMLKSALERRSAPLSSVPRIHTIVERAREHSQSGER